MREIKFRGLSINGKMFIGNLTILKKPCNNLGPGCYISNSAGMPFAYHVQPKTIGEYTGLKDKNGKEIYEGDIVRFADKWEWYRGEWAGGLLATEKDKKEVETDHVKYPYQTEVVEYNQGSFWPAPASELPIYWEVIGNIHENPELLKGCTK
jgi:uncharacterized phage protein (TIGR01671 family)